jgi:hypothetical protein
VRVFSSNIYLKKPLPTVLPHLKPRFRRLATLPAAIFNNPISPEHYNKVSKQMGRFGDRFIRLGPLFSAGLESDGAHAGSYERLHVLWRGA